MAIITPLKKIFNWQLASEKIQQPAYKVYTALLNQTGINNPVATVTENTTGYDFIWVRQQAGFCTCAFDPNGFYPDPSKIVVFYSPGNFNAFVAHGQYQYLNPSSAYIDLATYDETFTAVDFDGLVHVEIRVYN